MTDPLSYRCEDGIATLTLAHGKVNALSPEVIEALDGALARAEREAAVVVLTGQPGILSAGYDLSVMNAGQEDALALVAAGSALTRRMLAHPCPLIVACTGHAVAKGAFLLLAADYRIGVEGPFRIGLNEVRIGIPMPYAGIELARDRLTRRAYQRAVINAEMFDPRSALEAGFLDQLVPAEQLPEAVMAQAAKLRELDPAAHRQTKLRVRQGLLAALDLAIDRDRQRHG